MDDRGLVGRWSVEARYGATSMEDEELVFKPDGTGWCEYARPIYSRFTLFRWSTSVAGRLRLSPYRVAHSQEGRASGQIVDAPRVPRPVEVGYRIALEDVRETRGAGMLLVLRVHLPIAELRDGAYGLLTRGTPPGERSYLPWLDGPRSA
jgi:hypothetical protein